MFFVHGLTQGFQHPTDLHRHCAVGIDSGTLEHPFQVFLDWFKEVLLCEFKVTDVNFETIPTCFRQDNQHGGLKQQLLFRTIIPFRCGFGNVFEVTLKVGIPFDIPFPCARAESELSAFVLKSGNPLLEVFNAFRRWVFRDRNDPATLTVDKHTPSGKTSGKHIHLEVSFKHVRSETAEKGDVRM